MSLIWTIIIGFIVGLLARAVLPGTQKLGFILTTLLGIAGALAVTYLGQAMGWYTAGEGAGFIASILGAIVLLLIVGMLRRR
ncbi:MAG: GlsB/YeaQ/YmgE family stress response membrane protein [Burkholderiaceae bacterium]